MITSVIVNTYSYVQLYEVIVMKGYGVPQHIFDNPDDALVELFGLKSGESAEIKRNGTTKRAIRKNQKHSERFKIKQQIIDLINMEY